MAPNTRYPPWSLEETDRLIALYRAGHSWTEIAEKMGRSREGCRSKARDLLLTKGRSRGHNRVYLDFDDIHTMLLLNYSRDEIASELGICVRTLYRHMKEHGGSLFAFYKKQNKERKHEGLTYRWRKNR